MVDPDCDAKPVEAAWMECGGHRFGFYNDDVYFRLADIAEFQHIFDKMERDGVEVFFDEGCVYVPISWMKVNCPGQDRSVYEELESTMRTKFMANFQCG